MLQSVRLGNVPSPAVLVFAKFQDGPLPESALQADSLGLLSAAVARADFSGGTGSLAEVTLPRDPAHDPARRGKSKPSGPASGLRLITVGLGKAKDFTPAAARDAAAAVARRLASTRDELVALDFASALQASSKAADLRAAGRAAGEAFGLLAWDHLAFKGKATDKKPRPALTIAAHGPAFASGFQLGLDLAASTNLARTLSETPPNIATPDWIAQQAQKLAKTHGLRCSVLRGKDLERERLVGHINVGKASENKPCFIRLAYSPKKPRKNAKPLVLIGKTMTYDTGGLSLKVNNGMVGMKRDKDGGCAVLGAMHAIASAIKPDIPVVALLCAAENSISDEAYRPDDVLTYRNGVTVEITNTDAEGRLVLADGLCWACDNEQPAAIVDLATLTGGVVVALGSTYCGMFCEHNDLRAQIESASASSGERVWRLPMHAEYRDMMKSPIADILNSNPNRKAHPIQGAAFLSYFVDGFADNKTPWCHLDIAGVHASEADAGCFVKGPTGWGVRLLADLAASM